MKRNRAKRFFTSLIAVCLLLSAAPASASGVQEDVSAGGMLNVEPIRTFGLPEEDERQVLKNPFEPPSRENSMDSNLPEWSVSASVGSLPAGDVPLVQSDIVPVTRGAWVSELVDLFGLTSEEYPDVYFPDIEGTDYYDAIMTATMCGLIDVEAGDCFEPEGALTQGFSVRTLNYRLGIQPTEESSDPDAQVAMERGWFNGTYDANAPVTAEQSAAMLSDAKTILDSRKAPEPVSDFQFANDVVVIPETAEISVLRDAERMTIRISGWDGVLEPQQVFAFYYQKFAYVYAAESVDCQDGGVLYITTSSAPENAVVSARFVGEIVPELTFIPDENVVTLMDGEGQPVVFGAAKTIDAGRDYIKIARTITLSDGVTGSLNVEITNLRISRNPLDGSGGFKIEGDAYASSTVKFDLLSGDGKISKIPLGGISLGPVGYVGVAIDLKLEAKLSYAFRMSFALGAEIRDGKLIDLCGSEMLELPTFSAEGTASAELCLTADVDFGWVGAASATLGIGPVIKATRNEYSSGAPRVCKNLAGYLGAGASYYGKLLGKSFGKRFDFYTAKNSPVRFSEHIEDGVTVYACTRGTSSVNPNAPKYISPWNSSIYVSGNPNNSSTGMPEVIWHTSDNGDGTVTVTGYSGGGSILNIPETVDGKNVTAIGEAAFQKRDRIRLVVIPDTVTEIGRYAFEGCANLEIVEFGQAVGFIDSYAFHGCDSLTAADLPEGLTKLGDSCFANCSSLERAYIPSTLSEVEFTLWGTFFECAGLNEITFGTGIISIPGHLFRGCTGLTHIEIPDTVTEIGIYAFEDCTNLEVVEFGQAVGFIDSYAFQDCVSLISADLPEGLTKLGDSCFAKCSSLERAHIPSTLSEVEFAQWGNFFECARLNQITFGAGITAIPRHLFRGCTGLTHVEIPDTVTEVGYGAFEGCANLVSVKFGRSISSIDYYAFQDCVSLTSADLPEGLLKLGEACFGSCTALEQVYIPGTLNEVDAGLNPPFCECEKLDQVTFGQGIPAIPDQLFGRCTGLTHITIPDTVTEIGNYAFQGCANLATVEIPDSVTKYGYELFSECKSLISISLSKAALDIPQQMFAGCTALEYITIPEGVERIHDLTFNECAALWDVVMPNTVTVLERGAFRGCTSLKDLTWVCPNVTTIESGVFENCTGLTSAILPDSAGSLGDSAFKGCSDLMSFRAGTNLKEIGPNCFQDCVKLTDVALNQGLEYLGGYAFQNCAALQNVVLPDTVTEMGGYAFQKCAALKSVALSKGLIDIPEYSFSNCTSLKSIKLPNGVTTIEDYAFYQDTSLSLVTIPQTVTHIGSNAFSYPRNMTVRGWSDSYAEQWAIDKGSTFINLSEDEAGVMEAPDSNRSVEWSFSRAKQTVTISIEIPEDEQICIARYDIGGRFLGIETVSKSTVVDVSKSEEIQLIWVAIDTYAPVCGSKKLSQ